MIKQKKSSHKLNVDQSASGTRLDKYLSTQLNEVSRSRIQSWLQHGHVLVNGAPGRAKSILRGGEKVTISPPSPTPTNLIPENIPINILYEDSDLVVVNKAPGIVVHPGAGQTSGTLVHGLLAKIKDLSGVGGEERPGIVHRLDKGTSGAIVIAKNDFAHVEISRQFAARETKKEYLALCYGAFKVLTGKIDKPIGRHLTQRKKMSINSKQGREAHSEWEVKEEFGKHLSLVKVKIMTGRTHQIRVHLSSEGHPLVGDDTYGGGARTARQLPAVWRDILLTIDSPVLHSWHLDFSHPRTGENISIEAPLPEYFTLLLESLRKLME